MLAYFINSPKAYYLAKVSMSKRNTDLKSIFIEGVVQRHVDNLWRFKGAISFLFCFDLFNSLASFHATDNSAKHSMLVVKPRAWNSGDEELAPICAWPSICH